MTEAAEVDIDPATGLPVLPEGFSYEVKPHVHQSPREPFGWFVSIKRRWTDEHHFMAREKKGLFSWHWVWRETLINHEEDTGVYGYINGEKRVYRDKTKEELEADELTDYDPVGVVFVKHEFVTLTDELILAAAIEAREKLYERWRTDKERTDRAEANAAFYGEYPPKSLGE